MLYYQFCGLCFDQNGNHFVICTVSTIGETTILTILLCFTNLLSYLPKWDCLISVWAVFYRKRFKYPALGNTTVLQCWLTFDSGVALVLGFSVKCWYLYKCRVRIRVPVKRVICGDGASKINTVFRSEGVPGWRNILPAFHAPRRKEG